MSCEKHKRTIEKYQGTLKELANDIGDLHYEALAHFLSSLSLKISIDAMKDFEGNRKKLADKLFTAKHHLSDATDAIWDAWLISKPYMEKPS